jgi:hypothetical protein
MGMNEEPEMNEQNDPAKHAEREVDRRDDDSLGGPEARNAGSPSPSEAEMRRDRVPGEL